MSLVYTTALLTDDTPIAVEQGTVRVGDIGHDLRIVGEPDDLTRLASALLEAAGVGAKLPPALHPDDPLTEALPPETRPLRQWPEADQEIAMSHPNTERRLARIAAAASYYCISEKTLRRRIEDGSVPAYRFGPRVLMVDMDELAAALVTVTPAGA